MIEVIKQTLSEAWTALKAAHWAVRLGVMAVVLWIGVPLIGAALFFILQLSFMACAIILHFLGAPGDYRGHVMLYILAPSLWALTFWYFRASIMRLWHWLRSLFLPH